MESGKRFCIGLFLFLCGLVRVGHAQTVDPWDVIERSIQAERETGCFDVQVHRHEFFMAAPRASRTSRDPGPPISEVTRLSGEFQIVSRLKTSDVMSRGTLERTLSYSFRTQDLEDGKKARFMRVSTLAQHVLPEGVEPGSDLSEKAVNVQTVSAESLFQRLEPARAELQVIGQERGKITLRVVSLDIQELTRSPIYLRATFDRSSGLLLVSELMLYDLPLVVTTFEYRTASGGRHTLFQRVMRTNTDDGVRVSVDRYEVPEDREAK